MVYAKNVTTAAPEQVAARVPPLGTAMTATLQCSEESVSSAATPHIITTHVLTCVSLVMHLASLGVQVQQPRTVLCQSLIHSVPDLEP